MDIILRYRSAPADVKDQIRKTFREEAEWQTEKEKASNLIDIIFLKSQNQFDISIFKKEAIITASLKILSNHKFLKHVRSSFDCCLMLCTYVKS